MACVKYGEDQIWDVSSMEEIKYGICQVGRSNMACVK